MIALIQRVSKAQVNMDGRTISSINEGMLVLLGVRRGDSKDQAKKLAERCVNLRIFEDEDGKFNLSLKDKNGAALVVSQFTLLADASRGRRPSFTDAEEPVRSKELYEHFIQVMNECGIKTSAGVFGARMRVSLDNEGPVTIVMEE